MINNNDDITKEKEQIENDQSFHEEEIIEVDEAAQSAEGLKNRDSNETEDVREDRAMIENTAIDIPDSSIIK